MLLQKTIDKLNQELVNHFGSIEMPEFVLIYFEKHTWVHPCIDEMLVWRDSSGVSTEDFDDEELPEVYDNIATEGLTRVYMESNHDPKRKAYCVIYSKDLKSGKMTHIEDWITPRNLDSLKAW